MTAPTREEFAERLLKGSVKKSYAPVVDIDWDAPLDPDKFFLPPKTVSLYGTPLWDAMTREQQIELSRAGTRQHAVGGHLVREHPQPGAAAQDDAPGPDRQRHALRADRARRRDPPHGDVRQGDRAGRRQAGAAAALPADHHQPAAVRVPGLGAVGGRADRRGDLRLAAAADDGRCRTAADGAAAHADSRHRGGPAHPVRPRRVAQADADMRWLPKLFVRQHQRARRVLLPVPVHQQGAVPPRRAGRPPGAPRWRAAARTAARSRCSGSPRWRVPRRGRADGADRPPDVATNRLPAPSERSVRRARDDAASATSERVVPGPAGRPPRSDRRPIPLAGNGFRHAPRWRSSCRSR